MAKKLNEEAQNPLILRCNRLIEAFSKSNDERDFYLDKQEGFIIYADLDKSSEELAHLEKELKKRTDNYCMIPKLTFYETKKIMEGFIHEKVYDIDTKEKLLDIIQSKEARENFLEFIHDHHSEFEKWQAYYQERSRIRIIEWLRANGFTFVFEEDLEFPKLLLERLKKELFETKVGKDVANARKILIAKAKTYYSNEALNPRPKRGRPPKQTLKAEIEPQISIDIYTTVPNGLRPFLFVPDLQPGSGATFSSRFGHEDETPSSRRPHSHEMSLTLENLNNKLQALRSLTSKWKDGDTIGKTLDNSPVESNPPPHANSKPVINGIKKTPLEALPVIQTKKRTPTVAAPKSKAVNKSATAPVSKTPIKIKNAPAPVKKVTVKQGASKTKATKVTPKAKPKAKAPIIKKIVPKGVTPSKTKKPVKQLAGSKSRR